MRAQAKRRKAERWGRYAEMIAACWLRLKGYRILERRARTPFGEIDIVAQQGGILVFVEVKARASLAQAADSLTPRTRQRIGRAAALIWSRHAGRHGRHGDEIKGGRIDVILICPWSLPHHMIGAWLHETG